MNSLVALCCICGVLLPVVLMASSVMRLTRRLFAICLWRYRHTSPWPFCWRIAVEGVIVSAIVAVPMTALGASTRDPPKSTEDFVFSAVLLAPWLETLLFQSLPIAISRLCGARTGTQALVSIVPFFLAHLALGAVPGIAAGLIGGFYLAVAYIRWRRRDWWTAFWVTTLSHAIRNGMVVAVVLSGP